MKKKEADDRLSKAKDDLKAAERRFAVAGRVLEKINNFSKEFDVFAAALSADTTELGVKSNDLVSLAVSTRSVEQIRDAAQKAISDGKKQLDPNEPSSLAKELADFEVKLNELRAKLDAPNREYQSYLKQLQEWQAKLNELEGSATDADSLKGLMAALQQLDSLPQRIDELKAGQNKLALEIHAEKVAQAKIYRTLYQPVQQFIDSHELAKGKLRLEFRAELTNEGFDDRLLALLALNRRGSFMGVEEGHAKVEKFTQVVNWEDAESVTKFLADVDHALHFDERETPAESVQLKDQLASRKKAEDVFDLLYGLDYVMPRYVLKWEGKDISMLSPGERGTLLLVFYLLIDKSDLPLIIDQPEGNLDNHTVAKILVDCIREARSRRQVFIVTHNPNLAVVCDADQVVYVSMNKEKGNAITYHTGSLENPITSEHVTDVLEGTRWAFGVRGKKYDVALNEN